MSLQEADEVELESCARIKHLLSETWLLVAGLFTSDYVIHSNTQHAQSQNTGPYKRQGYNPEDVGLEGLQWDSAILFEVSMISHASTIDN